MEPGSQASKLEKLTRLTGTHLGLRYRIIIIKIEHSEKNDQLIFQSLPKTCKALHNLDF